MKGRLLLLGQRSRRTGCMGWRPVDELDRTDSLLVQMNESKAGGGEGLESG